MLRILIADSNGEAADPAPLIEAVAATLRSNSLDPALKAEAILLPSEAIVGDRMEMVDPDSIHAARDRLRSALGTNLNDGLLACYRGEGGGGDDLSPSAKGGRKLRIVALGLIAAADPKAGAELAKHRFDAADNMTDRQGALGILVSLDRPERQAALDAFYERFKDDQLVLDKWFGLQAAAQRPGTIDEVERLARHPDFTIANPNRLRSLTGSFSVNQWLFHAADGRGYRFLADMILAAEKVNPQVAARLVPPFGRWRRFDDKRAALMRAQLDRIVATPGLSKDVFEQASKSLG